MVKYSTQYILTRPTLFIDVHFKGESFDETCCKLKGVPKECMGNCRDAEQSLASRVRGLPPAFCDDYKDAIKECVVIRKRGI